MPESDKPTTTAELSARHFNIEGIVAFLDAYFAAPNDADMELRIASPEEDPQQNILLVTLEHPTIQRTVVGVNAPQARKMAEIAEDAMRKFAGDPGTAGLPNLILALRHGADKLEEIARG